MREIIGYATSWTGNPAALPASLFFAWRYGTSLDHYERIGAQLFRNFELIIGSDDDTRFLIDGWHPAEMANGVSLGAFDMAHGLQMYELAVPAGVLARGVNRIELRYAWSASPSDLGMGDDARQLAVAFREISLVSPA